MLERRFGLWLSLLLSGLFVGLFYGKVLLRPNDFLFSLDVDGLNNYRIGGSGFQPFESKIYDGHWAYREMVFAVRDTANQVRLRAEGSRRGARLYYLDELLIRPEPVDLYKIEWASKPYDRVYVKNNLTLLKD